MRWVLLVILGIFPSSQIPAVEWVVTDSTVQKEAPIAPPVADHFYFFTSQFCAPCKRMEANEIKKLKAAGYRVTTIDVDEEPRFKIRTTPTTWRASGEKWVQGWVGYTSAETLLRSVSVAVPKAKPVVTQSPVVTVRLRDKAEIRAEKHLREEHGIIVEGLSLLEMERIHDTAHGGDPRRFHFPGMRSIDTNPRFYQLQFPGVRNCPNGRCPN